MVWNDAAGATTAAGMAYVLRYSPRCVDKGCDDPMLQSPDMCPHARCNWRDGAPDESGAMTDVLTLAADASDEDRHGWMITVTTDDGNGGTHDVDGHVDSYDPLTKVVQVSWHDEGGSAGGNDPTTVAQMAYTLRQNGVCDWGAAPDPNCRDPGDDCCANELEGESAACADGFVPSNQPQSWDGCPNFVCEPCGGTTGRDCRE